MPIDLQFIEEDLEEIRIDDLDDLNVQAMGNVYIKYADSNAPESLEDTYDEPITDEHIHPYIGIGIGIQEPISVLGYNWCVRDLTAIQDSLNNLQNTKQDLLDYSQTLAVNSGITQEKREAYDSHLDNISNPHRVTKVQVDLGNVVNTADSDNPEENGNKKFTTGGAYTLKNDLQGKIDDEKSARELADTNIEGLITAEETARKNADQAMQQDLANKQDLLVSGTNIKKINGQDILGSGNLVVEIDPSQPIKTWSYDGVHTLEQVMNTKADATLCVGYTIIEEE